MAARRPRPPVTPLDSNALGRFVVPPSSPPHARRRGRARARRPHASTDRAGSSPPRIPVRGFPQARARRPWRRSCARVAELPERRPDRLALRHVRVVPLHPQRRRRSTWPRWTRPPTTRSTTSATRASASPSPPPAAASRPTSSTRRTCSPPQARNAFLEDARGAAAAHRSSCWRQPRPTRSWPTAVDRCHRFNFSAPVRPEQIASNLRRVADMESIGIPDEATRSPPARPPAPSRDALGTLEQLLAYSGSTIELQDVLGGAGAADATSIFGAVDAASAGDARGALLAAARAGRVRPRPGPLRRRPGSARPRPDGRPGASATSRPSCA